MSRDLILQKIRTALGRSPGQLPPEPPPPRIAIPEVDRQARIQSLFRKVEALAAKTWRAPSKEAARDYVAGVLDGRAAVASGEAFLAECGITALPGVRSGIQDPAELRSLCAAVPVGITSADYALADTGSLVLLASARSARMISLLPPVHIAVLPLECILTGLDELFHLLPRPAGQTSSMVLITGPSRTADIEQILVRGVHGPGELHIVVV
ncbi:MAG: lactate utilization protein [Bryobacterales bacterium]|nr:lactate utilization protein [Bryobacterales bacterium]